MAWQKSAPARLFLTGANLAAIVGLLVGAYLVLEWKGPAWGAPPAVVTGGMAGWLIGFALALLAQRAISQRCPVCRGTGRLAGITPAVRCDRCAGRGKIL
jgi:hypothetical protein